MYKKVKEMHYTYQPYNNQLLLTIVDEADNQIKVSLGGKDHQMLFDFAELLYNGSKKEAV